MMMFFMVFTIFPVCWLTYYTISGVFCFVCNKRKRKRERESDKKKCRNVAVLIDCNTIGLIFVSYMSLYHGLGRVVEKLLQGM